MTDEHMGTCIYDKGRFELRETDNAIIDLKGDFPPIMIASNTVDDGSEPNCADKGSVLHLLNELSDNNPNEERHWYLKKILDKAWKQYHEQKEENEQLKKENQYLKSLKWNQDCINEINIGMQQRQSLERQNNELVKENEQLKQELKDYHNAFDCSQCKYQNYDWFDDDDEFEVCDKGNNEAQMDNHSCTDWEEYK